MHVVMMLAGLARKDTRVLREAAWLARSGLDVTILARSSSGHFEFSQVAGAQIVRVPIEGRVYRGEVTRRARLRHLGYLPASHMEGRDQAELRKRARKSSDELRFIRAPLPVKVVLKARAETTKHGRRIIEAAVRKVDKGWDAFDRRMGDVELGASWRRTLKGRVDDLELAFGPMLDLLLPDAIHAHDMHVLGVAAHAAYRAKKRGRDVKLVYDAHEYVRGMALFATTTKRGLSAWARLEDEYIGYADEVITVSPEIAEAMQRDHNLPRTPTVLLNVPVPRDDVSTAPSVRRRCGLPDDTPLAVYSGVLHSVRGVEEAILALEKVPDLHLAVVSVPSAYTPQADAMRALAASHGLADRVHLVDPVDAPDVPAYLSSADFGVIPIHGGWLSYDYALPNKFFEYLSAGLPLAVSDLPTMGRLVRAESLGTTFTDGDPESLAEAYRDMLANLPTYTANAVGSGLRAESDWRRQESLLRSVYERTLGVRLRPDGDIDPRPLVLEETPVVSGPRQGPTFVAIGPENHKGWASALAVALADENPDIELEVTAIRGVPTDPYVVHTPHRRTYHEATWQAGRSMFLQRRMTHAVWEEGKPIGGDYGTPTCLEEARALVSSGGRGVIWLHHPPDEHMEMHLEDFVALGIPLFTSSQEVVSVAEDTVQFVARDEAPQRIAEALGIATGRSSSGQPRADERATDAPAAQTD